jgi:hypothetical protein
MLLSPLAALMAFLIMFDEYSHHYTSKAEPLKLALQDAIVTLIFFIVISLLVSFVLSHTM